MNRIKISSADKRFDIFNHIFAITFFIIVLYPVIYVISASFSSPKALMSGKVWLFPVEPGIEGYKAVFAEKKIWTGFANSLFYAFTGTIINVAMTVMAAYPLSRKDLVGKKVITMLFTFTMIFSAGMIPSFLAIQQYGLLNSRWALLLPGALNVYNMIITRTYFVSNISDELLESAQIDGCSDLQFFLQIVLPLSKSVIAVITLFYVVGHWNNFFSALLYLNDAKKFPLQIFLREILTMNAANDLTMSVQEEGTRLYLAELLKYSLIIVSTVPLMVLYPFIQKHFVKGVMVGSVKG